MHTFDLKAQARSFLPTATVTVYETIERPSPTPQAMTSPPSAPPVAARQPECEARPMELEPKQFRLSSSLFPSSEKSDVWTSENNRMIRELFRCLEDDCRVNQDKGE